MKPLPKLTGVNKDIFCHDRMVFGCEGLLNQLPLSLMLENTVVLALRHLCLKNLRSLQDQASVTVACTLL